MPSVWESRSYSCGRPEDCAVLVCGCWRFRNVCRKCSGIRARPCNRDLPFHQTDPSKISRRKNSKALAAPDVLLDLALIAACVALLGGIRSLLFFRREIF